jgi:UDP-N-acetylglucosamine 1-carboxyvinyltransferase
VISTLQPDGLDADFEPILAALLCGCSGSAIIEDAINPERHSRFLPYLIAAGADISVHTPTRAAIRGPTRFRPFVGIAGDIRGGASQLLAAVAAEGDSLLYNPSQIDRGYSRLDLKLERLGASIVRTPKLNFGM